VLTLSAICATAAAALACAAWAKQQRWATLGSVVHHLYELDGPLLVERHHLGHKGLEVEYGLAAKLQAVFVEGGALEHSRLEAVVHLLQQFQGETLPVATSSAW
jgi:hypothetical protein